MKWEYSNYSYVDDNVHKLFPFKNARVNQLETISEIKHAIDEGYKYIVLEAGTGTGKSAIAATLALMYDSTYILTVTKQLQDQYLKDFKQLNFRLVKGRANFPCRKYAEDNIHQNCDEGRCKIEGYNCEYSIKNKYEKNISPEATCYYDYQKYLGLVSKVVISNYHYLFLELNYVNDFTKRELMIFDEAHKLEESIMSLLKLEFDRKELKEHAGINLSKQLVRKLNLGDYKDWINFIERVREIYQKEFDKIKNIKNRPELNTKKLYLQKRIDDCYIFIKHIMHDPDKWIFDYDSYWGIAQFKPIKVDKYAKDTFLRYGDVCVFMSATILDYKLFAEWLGLNEDEIYAIRQKSPFEINRNPIKTFKHYNMSFTNLEESAPLTIDAINNILEKHKDDKGIIHTVSYKCKNYLKRKISNPRLIDHKTHDRAKKLKVFRDSDEPLVLISPSMSEGVDLPGDLCRFQIIYKIPYPNVGDKQTNLRMKIDKQWFKYKTSLALVQTLGRGMRFEDDYCMTYFIDSRLKGYVRTDKITNKFLPDTFTDAIDIEPAVIKSPAHEISENEISKKSSFDGLLKKVMNIKPSAGGGIDRTVNELKEYRHKVDLKYDLILKGKSLIQDNNIAEAIELYNDLLNHELFLNDYHPYLKLAKIYELENDLIKEADIISDFLKSGIYARKSVMNHFTNRVKKLNKLGFIDASEIFNLKKEYGTNLKYPNFPISYHIIKTNKNANKNGNPFNPDSFKQIVNQDLSIQKLDLILVGDKLMGMKEYDRAIAYYESLLDHPLFDYDYYLYRKLAKAYHKHHKYNDEVDIIVEFYKSGTVCNKTQLKWFKNQLKKNSKYGNFDYSLMDSLEEEYKNNQILQENNPENNSKPLNSVKKSLFENNYSRTYFNTLAKQITQQPDYISDRDLLKHKETEYIEITSNHDEIDLKADFKNKGKELEKENPTLAIEYYNLLKKSRLFENDYYPYRRQCILFKNKIKDDEKDWITINEIFRNEIYLNDYQYIWLKNKVLELIEKLQITDDSEIRGIIKKYDENKENYKKLQDQIPIAERIIKDENGLRLLSLDKYDKLQNIFYVKELGVGYIRRKEYEIAISYYKDLLKSDFLYYNYHAYKQLGRIVNEMDAEEFKIVYEKQ